MSGSSLKILLQRCKHLTCLLLQQTGLVGDHVTGAEWDKGGGDDSFLCVLMSHLFAFTTNDTV